MDGTAQINDVTAWLKARIGAHVLHPMTDPATLRTEPPAIAMRGDGVHIIDVDGRRMIDCSSALWCVNSGYSQDEIKDAVKDQLDRLPYYSLFPGSANGPAIELAERICAAAAPEGMVKAFFGSGGSDTIEAALKLSRQYWKIVGQPERTKYISLRGGYHGTHFGAMSANGDPAFRRSYEPMVPGFINVEAPNPYRPLIEGTPDELVDLCIRLMEREIVFQSPDTIAAVLAEPVQGAGGVIVPPASYWPRLRALCDKYDILLISDEVVTGYGRTGAMFGCRGWGVKPDIMCLAKGISGGYQPLSATLLNERVASAWEGESPYSTVAHGNTYGGNPVSCAAGIAALTIVEREGLPGNARIVGDYLLEKLRPLKERHGAIGDVRGKGLMIAIEMVKDRRSKEPFGHDDSYPLDVSNQCIENGIMLRRVAHKFIISPPLNFTMAHADEVVAALDDAYARNPWDGEAGGGRAPMAAAP